MKEEKAMRIVNGGTVSGLLRDTPIPKMFRASQSFPASHISPEEIPSVIAAEIGKPEISGKIKPGMSIAITAGSRGIRNVDIITKTIVDEVKARGAFPFIVPAMGSHGGATAEGQLRMLEGYHITPETMGCPVRSSMEVVQIGVSSRGNPVYMDRNAWESDGVIVSCRIKPHSSFRGKIESGVCKMMTVGLGKQRGASMVHDDGVEHMAENIPTMADVVIRSGKILFAIPCLENAYDETCHIESILPENILEREPELLQEAFRRMPSLLVREADVLIVDEIGKNYSGPGVDPNITGTFSTPYVSGGLKVQRTAFLNLSKESHSNALGVGLANAITAKIFNDMDPEQTYPNCITSTVLASARIPCVLATDKEAVQICLKTLTGIPDRSRARVVRIPNSLHIEKIMLSEAYYEDVIAGKYEGLYALDEPAELDWDEDGNLITPIDAAAVAQTGT